MPPTARHGASPLLRARDVRSWPMRGMNRRASAAISDGVSWPTLIFTEVELTDYPQEVTQRFHGTPKQMSTALIGVWPRRSESIVIEDYDPAWVDRFAAATSSLHDVLGIGRESSTSAYADGRRVAAAVPVLVVSGTYAACRLTAVVRGGGLPGRGWCGGS
jgi:hypothetical protein